jgi:hypothetical protein
MLQHTFTSARTSKCEQTIRLSTRMSGAVLVESNPRDGAAGSALLTEMRMRLGLDVALQKEHLKVLLVCALCVAKFPLQAIGSTSRFTFLNLNSIGSSAHLFAKLRMSGERPSVDALLCLTWGRSNFPVEIIARVQEFAGGMWWGRDMALGLPCPSEGIFAFSADIPRRLKKHLKTLVCFPCTRFHFSTGIELWAEWAASGDQLWMRGKTLVPLISLIRCERRGLARQGPAYVIHVRGLGDVFV